MNVRHRVLEDYVSLLADKRIRSKGLVVACLQLSMVSSSTHTLQRLKSFLMSAFPLGLVSLSLQWSLALLEEQCLLFMSLIGLDRVVEALFGKTVLMGLILKLHFLQFLLGLNVVVVFQGGTVEEVLDLEVQALEEQIGRGETDVVVLSLVKELPCLVFKIDFILLFHLVDLLFDEVSLDLIHDLLVARWTVGQDVRAASQVYYPS